ncbi:Isoleucine--tRNA ligase [Geodia barretti]|uniref:DNA-(apurinic or apyrimidinic site) lyase n=1 Tax=Geodia barretti TaxID=519541 RepID=A0AA35RM72_GEOBA|nr:Isoleucine--tRNA ligase [Geodia barretti]
MVNETLRRVLLTLWNVYSFFTNYANIDQFEPDQITANWQPEVELDRWILSELNLLVQQVDDHLDKYNPTDAGRRIQEFIDVLSNWYVRRSRRRFWKSESDTDKLGAYSTLYNCLTTVAKLMAPLAPFVAEQMYRNLELRYDPEAPDSVHLASYPIANESLIDRPLMDATRLAQRVASMGRAARSKAGIKVRQPLASVVVHTRTPEENEYLDWVRSQILEELNIKELQPAALQPDSTPARKGPPATSRGHRVIRRIFGSLEAGYMVAIDTRLTPELADEGLARELAHRIQNLRKGARYEITDRIITFYEGPDDVMRVMTGHQDYIMQETLSEALLAQAPDDDASSETQRIEGMEVTLGYAESFLKRRPSNASAESTELMPPEIHDARAARGRKHAPVSVAGGPSVGEFIEGVVGRRVEDVRRRGKYLIAPLDDGNHLVLHLGMTGSLRIRNADVPVGPMVRHTFPLDDGRQLRFGDPRKFGHLWLLSDPADAMSKMGPEPLEPCFTREALTATLGNRKAPIKALLLEQSVVAGLGNLYADEALFLSIIPNGWRAVWTWPSQPVCTNPS